MVNKLNFLMGEGAVGRFGCYDKDFLTWSEIVNLTAVTTVLLANAESELR